MWQAFDPDRGYGFIQSARSIASILAAHTSSAWHTALRELSISLAAYWVLCQFPNRNENCLPKDFLRRNGCPEGLRTSSTLSSLEEFIFTGDAGVATAIQSFKMIFSLFFGNASGCGD